MGYRDMGLFKKWTKAHNLKKKQKQFSKSLTSRSMSGVKVMFSKTSNQYLITTMQVHLNLDITRFVITRIRI